MKIVAISLLLLISGMSFGIISEAYAQDDPNILLKIVKRTQEQIQNQISYDSSDKIKDLFEKGTSEINYLEKSLQDNDLESAKEYFLSAMKTFKEISTNLTPSEFSSSTNSISEETKNLSGKLDRLQAHVDSLKLITENHDVTFDYSGLDELFIQAKQFIRNNQIAETLETIDKIKAIITEVKLELHELALKQESHRAKEYAQKYLERIDRLIEQAKKQSIPSEIIIKLEKSRENLSLTENPEEIIQEIRNIVSIKQQFDLAQNDRYESKILKIEKTIYLISQSNQITENKSVELQRLVQEVKYHLHQGEISTVEELLKNITTQIEEIKKSP